MMVSVCWVLYSIVFGERFFSESIKANALSLPRYLHQSRQIINCNQEESLERRKQVIVPEAHQ